MNISRVLVVDDDTNFRGMLRLFVQRLCPSCHVVEANNGAAAYEQYQREGAHLILTDDQMPMMNGIELVQRLRGEGVQTPIVLLSGHVAVEAELREHADTIFLAKPVRLPELRAHLERLLPG